MVVLGTIGRGRKAAVVEFRTSNASVPAPPAPGALLASRPLGSHFLAAALLAALAAVALFIDLPVARWLNERSVPGEWKRLVQLSEVFGWGGSVALIILVAARLDQRGWRIVPRLAVAALGAGLFADGIKLLLARLRPSAASLDTMTALDTFVAWLPAFHRDSLPSSYAHPLQSFPSAHAATAVGLALGLAGLYPRGRWLFACFATLACFQRIEAQAHFVSDVLAGAAVGFVVAGCVCGKAAGTAAQRWSAATHPPSPGLSQGGPASHR
jgi:membrane-associated phospholipid phosphatase